MNAKLRSEIVESLENQGFYVNGHVVPKLQEKNHYRVIQGYSKGEQIELNRKFIEQHFDLVQKTAINASQIDTNNIKLELRLVRDGTPENILFRWWNLTWWSVPFQKSYGRQMRFLLWDVTHDAPFALIGLQSPILKMAARDNYLNIPDYNLDLFINMSMQAQRLGALPPYNALIGGKMAALALTSNELRLHYSEKYKDSTTVIKQRKIAPELLFITTTSAFGRSSIYNRVKFNGQEVTKSLGYTKGSGTFHIPLELYKKIQTYLLENRIDVNTTFGYGPSRKIKLLEKAFSLLNLKEYHYHNIRREVFIVELVENLHEVIASRSEPKYHNRPLDELANFWKHRWAIGRSKNGSFINFKFDEFCEALQNDFKLNLRK